jgi:C1A family cysteine protease
MIEGEVDAAAAVVKPSAFAKPSGLIRRDFPVSFDLRDVGGADYVTSVKTQWGGTCWTHGAMAAIEGNILMTGLEWIQFDPSQEEPNLEEYHLDWWNGFNQYLNEDVNPPDGTGLIVHQGGDYLVTAAYLARSEGALDANNVLPVGDHFSNPPTRSDLSYRYYYVREIDWLTAGEDLGTIETVKEAVMTHGVVGTAFCFDEQFLDPWRGSHYQPPDDPYLPNHAVAIVGWDDTVSTQAPLPGAWLCKNSWGTGWGRGGYFWLSYHDKWCCKHPEMGAVSFHDVEFADFQDVYYHDYHGWRDTKSDCSRALNAFVANSTYLLTTLSFITAQDNVGYTLSVYDEFDETGPRDAFVTAAGFCEHTGYHTVDLDRVIRFVPGDRFYVELVLTDGGQAYDRTSEVPVLLGAQPEAPDVIVPSWAAPGQSYYRDETGWHDLYDFDSTANFCIKAMTEDQNPIIPTGEFGQAPLETTLSARWPQAEILSCLWTFDDGSTSDELEPSHTFVEPGIHTVRVEMVTDRGTYSCVDRCAALAYADTIVFEDGAMRTGGRLSLDVTVANGLPLTEMTIPFCWDGPLNLNLDSVSLAGCRTENLATAGLISVVPMWKKGTLYFHSGDQGYFAPGRGSVARLWFTAESSAPGTINPIGVADYLPYACSFRTVGREYRPELVDGEIVEKCCIGRVGDVDLTGGDEPTIGDVSALIDMLFISFVAVPCPAEADVNQTGGPDPGVRDITIGDLSYLIDYLFISGTSIGLPDCE